MKVLVTGSNGFIGKHMCLLLRRKGHEVFPFDVDDSLEELKEYLSKCDFVVHLAGINRPLSSEEFYKGNTNLTKTLCDLNVKNIPIIMSSSIQAELDNDYGKSKRLAEEYLLNSNVPAYVYRLANVIGKWCRPNYNSACATFCYNIAHDLPIEIRDRDYVVKFNYVEDVVNEFLNIIELPKHQGSKNILSVAPIYECSLGKLADLLYYFKQEVESNRHIPLIHNEFEFKLFKTFCNYLSDEEYTFNYAEDDRGSFEELYKSKKYGQISDNVAFIGITKGGHYHTYKKEIFYTVIGKSEIKQRNIKTNEMIVDVVDGKEPHPVKIGVEYAHQIKNIGQENAHTLMWISEVYNPDTPDTFKEDVEK